MDVTRQLFPAIVVAWAVAMVAFVSAMIRGQSIRTPPLMTDSTSEPPSNDRIQVDPQSLAMINDYRQRFVSAPIGMWVDCLDDYFGIGFGGCTGHFSETTFKEDGTGRRACREETVLFEWRRISERVIEVRSVENIPPLEGWSDAELAEERKWHRIEYDFVVPQYAQIPVIYDVDSRNTPRILDGTIQPSVELQFLECFGSPIGGPLKLLNNPREVSWRESNWAQIDAQRCNGK